MFESPLGIKVWTAIVLLFFALVYGYCATVKSQEHDQFDCHNVYDLNGYVWRTHVVIEANRTPSSHRCYCRRTTLT